MQKKIIAYKDKGKNCLMEIEYGIQNIDRDDAYFSITGYVWQQVRSKSGVSKYGYEYKLIDGKYYDMVYGGCIHDEIKKRTGEFNDLIPLHLSSLTGIPMHAFANGFYHIKNGFTDTPVSSDNFKYEFCKYYRIPVEIFEELSETKSQEDYAIVIMNNRVPDMWMAQANAAIKKYFV